MNSTSIVAALWGAWSCFSIEKICVFFLSSSDDTLNIIDFCTKYFGEGEERPGKSAKEGKKDSQKRLMKAPISFPRSLLPRPMAPI